MLYYRIKILKAGERVGIYYYHVIVRVLLNM